MEVITIDIVLLELCAKKHKKDEIYKFDNIIDILICFTNAG